MTMLPAELEPHAVTFRSHLGDSAEAAKLLSLPGALTQGHFQLLSGLHTNCFLAFSALADNPRHLERVAEWLGPTVDAWRADAVISPSTAGVGLAAVLARRISAPLHLAAVGPDGRPTNLVGSSPHPRARVLIVNDITTTGTGIRAMADLVRETGCVVAGAAWFASRSLDTHAEFDFPTVHAVDLELPAQRPEQCPACAGGNANIQNAVDLN